MNQKAFGTCYLFTQSYPYGNGEVFIGREMKYLSSYFNKVLIFPFNKGAGAHEALPGNVSVVNLFGDTPAVKKLSFSKKCSALILAIKELSKDPKAKNNFRWNNALIGQQLAKASIVKDFLAKQDRTDTVFYTYWFDSWALVLSLVKEKFPHLKVTYSSRAHGFDVFREQTRTGYHPFKSFMFKHVNGVYSVSEKGERYLKEQYPAYTAKVHQSYLGSEDNGLSVFKKEIFHIVSCAGVRKIKRIDLVPQILAALPPDFEVKWTLIGDGHMLEEVKEKCKNLGRNISCDFKGNLSNQEVMAFYRNNPIHLFLSVSESEGIPFTMIEAISFGIPLMSTDVGGCSEICTDATGILIEKDFEPAKVAAELVKFSRSEKNTEPFRKQVRAYWEQKFDAKRNFPAFYGRISAGTGN